MRSFSSEYSRPVYRLNKRRFIVICIAIILFIMAVHKIVSSDFISFQYKLDCNPEHLKMYFDVSIDQKVPWYYLAAVDIAEKIPPDNVNAARSGKVALYLIDVQNHKEAVDALRDYKDDKAFLKRVDREIKRLKNVNAVYEDKLFPMSEGYKYSFDDGFGGKRTYGGERKHEGIDIMCDSGVPLVAVCSGVVEQKGWLELGGWRIGIRGKDGIYYYYAHLSRYAPGIRKGSRVKKGDILGYTGNTGYGSEGTSGKFPPHLHFGMYEKGRAVNPYPFLKAWERKIIN